MPQRNGYKSHRGRSAVARRTEFGGASGTNGIMPSVYVLTTTGERVRTSYFGGPKKGGAAPSATGFMTASGARNTIATRAKRPNFLFKFRQSFSRGYPGAGVGAFGAAGTGPLGSINGELGSIDAIYNPADVVPADVGIVIDPDSNPIYIAALLYADNIASYYYLDESGTNDVIAAATAAFYALSADDKSAGIDTSAYHHAIAVINAASKAAAQAASQAG